MQLKFIPLLIAATLTFTANTGWADKGILKIVTEPGEAKIYINGKPKGTSSYKAGQIFSIQLDEGEYNVEAIKSSGAMEVFGVNNDVFIADDVMQTITLELNEERLSERFRKELAVKYANDMPLPNMIDIPAGSFRMGCVTGVDCQEDEKPVHHVTIDAFQMSATEVTFEEWDACVADAGCNHYPKDEGWGRGNRPVVNVSWDDVQEYLSWLKGKTGVAYRLPSEAEWEYAARAGSSTVYSWGNQIGKNNANCAGCGSQWDEKQTAPVASFKPNAFGLYDMHGNVWEWTQDCWNNSYNNAASNGRANRAGQCSQRVFRGGSWINYPQYLRYRTHDSRGNHGRGVGFRLSR